MKGPLTNDDLDLIPTRDLIDALGRRTTGLLVVTERETSDGPGYQTWWRHGWGKALGLARFADHDILTNVASRKPRNDDADPADRA